MYNPLTERIAEIHIEEQIRQAEGTRLAQLICQPQPGLSRRIGLAVSDLLIATGEKLRQRYDPGSCCEDCSHASA